MIDLHATLAQSSTVVPTAGVSSVGMQLLPIVATAVVGGIGVLLNEWRVNRNRHESNRRAVSDAVQYLEFISKWHLCEKELAQETRVGGSESWVQQELVRVRSLIVNRLDSEVDDDDRLQVQAALQRAACQALLLHPMQSIAARIVRTLFHLLLILGILLGLLDPTSPTLWSGALIVFLIPALALRALARHLSIRRSAAPRPHIAPSAPPCDGPATSDWRTPSPWRNGPDIPVRRQATPYARPLPPVGNMVSPAPPHTWPHPPSRQVGNM